MSLSSDGGRSRPPGFGHFTGRAAGGKGCAPRAARSARARRHVRRARRAAASAPQRRRKFVSATETGSPDAVSDDRRAASRCAGTRAAHACTRRAAADARYRIRRGGAAMRRRTRPRARAARRRGTGALRECPVEHAKMPRAAGGRPNAGRGAGRPRSPRVRHTSPPRAAAINVDSDSRCRPCSSKFPAASHCSNAERSAGHSPSTIEYHAVSRERPL